MKQKFTLPIRVYYEDTDAGGVVYHANYIKFMERGRSELMREIGFDLSSLALDGYLMVVRRAELDYLKPAKLGDRLDVITSLIETNGVKFIFQQDICLADDHEIVFCRGVITVVSINKKFRPCKMPLPIIEALSNVDLC